MKKTTKTATQPTATQTQTQTAKGTNVKTRKPANKKTRKPATKSVKKTPQPAKPKNVKILKKTAKPEDTTRFARKTCTKVVVFQLWKTSPKKTKERAETIAKEYGVAVATVKGWISSWSHGNNIPSAFAETVAKS